MGLIKDAIKKAYADMGIEVEFLNTSPQVIETERQAKYHDTLRAERGYTQEYTEPDKTISKPI